MGVSSPAFREKRGGQNALLAPCWGFFVLFCFTGVFFLVSFVQNNPYVKVAYLGAAYLATLHHSHRRT